MEPGELRERRAELRLTQAELGRALGVSANTVARWERGDMRIRHAELVAKALDNLKSQGAGLAAATVDEASCSWADPHVQALRRMSLVHRRNVRYCVRRPFHIDYTAARRSRVAGGQLVVS